MTNKKIRIRFEEIKMIKDFKIALKDFEPYVKNPEYLWTKKFSNFDLLIREAWGNWLLCTVLRNLHGEHITFAEDKHGDGLIIDKRTREIIPTEHVSALEIPKGKKWPKGEQRVIDAIDLKIKKGPSYAKGKWLIVFFDGTNGYFRNKIRENIEGRHNFNAVYCIGLLTSDKNGYAYAIKGFEDSLGDTSMTFKVQINKDFTDWWISQITQ